MGHDYKRHERLMIKVAIVLGFVAVFLTVILATKSDPRVKEVSPVEVWSYISEVAPERGFAPEFVYALAWAESSLNAKARSSVARGMMQLTKVAWSEVSDESYRHAWDWKTNVRVAIDYLAFCRDFLKRHDSFNYPLLAACYRYGPYYVRDQDFNIYQIGTPKNEIYQQIFEGDIGPVRPPGSHQSK